MGLVFNSVTIRHKIENMVADSRLVAAIKNVVTEKDVKSFIDELKREYPDAGYVPHAYLIYNEKTRKEKVGFSDDGELEGVAGEPILNSIRQAGFGNVAVAVVRFGTTLMSSVALSRGYETSAVKILKNAPVVRLGYLDIYELTVDYVYAKKVETIANEAGFKILQIDYEDDVFIKLAIDSKDYKKMIDLLSKALNSKVQAKFLESRFA